MHTYTFRLKENQDLRHEIQQFAKNKQIKAGVILCGVGNLKTTVLRMADGKSEKIFQGSHEIVSITGTVEADDCHLHIAISNNEGQTFGGHLKLGSIVGVTAEIVIQTIDNTFFKRELDETGYECLVVEQEK